MSSSHPTAEQNHDQNFSNSVSLLFASNQSSHFDCFQKGLLFFILILLCQSPWLLIPCNLFQINNKASLVDVPELINSLLLEEKVKYA